MLVFFFPSDQVGPILPIGNQLPVVVVDTVDTWGVGSRTDGISCWFAATEGAHLNGNFFW